MAISNQLQVLFFITNLHSGEACFRTIQNGYVSPAAGLFLISNLPYDEACFKRLLKAFERSLKAFERPSRGLVKPSKRPLK